MGMREDFQETLRLIYQQTANQLDKFWKDKTGNLFTGNKINASALPVDGITITVTAGPGGPVISSGGGTVTSIGVTVPTSVLAVSPASITGSGTFAFTLATQVSNTVWAGPTTGTAAAPTFRGLVPADIPSLDAAKIATGTFAAGRLPLATSSTPGAVQPDNVTTIVVAGVLSAMGSYTLPRATITTLGGVKVTSTAIGGQAPVAVVDPTVAAYDLLVRSFTLVTAVQVIAFFGDSITLGNAGTNGPVTMPDQTALNLSVHGMSVSGVNRGISGTTSTDWIPTSGTGYYTAAKAAAIAAGATLVHIMLGTNDAATGTSTSQATYQANLSAICVDLVSAGLTPVLTYPPYSTVSRSPTLLLAYQTAINNLVDGSTILLGAIKTWDLFQVIPADTTDGIHPNTAGVQDMAVQWAAALMLPLMKLAGTTSIDRLVLGANLTITPATVVNPASIAASGGGGGGTGVTVAAKGNIQGYSTVPANITTAGVNGNVLTEDSTAATGWASKPLPSMANTLAGLTDVTIHDLRDGDALTWVDVLGTWMNSTGVADYGATIIDDITGNTVVEDGSGFTVIADPLPVGVVADGTGASLVEDGTGKRVISG